MLAMTAALLSVHNRMRRKATCELFAYNTGFSTPHSSKLRDNLLFQNENRDSTLYNIWHYITEDVRSSNLTLSKTSTLQGTQNNNMASCVICFGNNIYLLLLSMRNQGRTALKLTYKEGFGNLP